MRQLQPAWHETDTWRWQAAAIHRCRLQHAVVPLPVPQSAAAAPFAELGTASVATNCESSLSKSSLILELQEECLRWITGLATLARKQRLRDECECAAAAHCGGPEVGCGCINRAARCAANTYHLTAVACGDDSVPTLVVSIVSLVPA